MAQIIFNLSVILLLIPINVFADSLTLTTYYPAPTGAYDRLRLVPRAAIGGTSCQVGMLFVNSGDGNKLYICAGDDVNSNWQPLVGSWAQQNPGGAPTVAMTNDAQGDPIYVGIGTTNPTGRLTVVGVDTSTTPALNVTDSASNSLFFVRDDGKVGMGTTAPTSSFYVVGTGTTISTSSLNVTDSSAKSIFFVRDDGNVGLGSTNPTSRFYVVGAGTTNVTSSLNVTDSASNSLLFVRNDGKVGIGTTTPASRLSVLGAGTTNATSSLNIADSAGNSLLFLRDDARIGIGTTNPSFDLHIDRDQNNALSSDWSSLYVDMTANPPNPAGANNHSAGFFYAYGPSAFMTGRSLNGVVGHAYTGTAYTGSANGVMGTVAATLTNNLSTGIGVNGLFSSSGSIISSPTVFRAYGVKGAVSLSNLTLTNDTAGVLGQASGSTNSSAALIGVKGSVDPGGTVNTAAGIYSAGVNVGSGVTTNAYSIYAFQPTESGGVITNAYTLYIKSPTDANTNYALYQEGNANNVFNGNVGIGTTAPGAKLEVNGQVKITDGNQGANKVLTSDANGLASWQASSSSGGSGGAHYYISSSQGCGSGYSKEWLGNGATAFYSGSVFTNVCLKTNGAGDAYYISNSQGCGSGYSKEWLGNGATAFYAGSVFTYVCVK